MKSITQRFLPIPCYPQTISVRHFSRRQAGNAAEIVKAKNELYLGLASSLSTSGEVGYIAVATTREVFLIAADIQNNLPFLFDKAFKDLLSNFTYSTLVGFDMARIAIQISRDLGTTVRGVDLGTLYSSNTRNPWQPGEFIAKKICASAKNFDISSLWGGGFEKDQRDVCLRAWISACAAGGVTTDLSNALKLDTGVLHAKELRCLGELVKQADLLDAAKPKEVPNEFTSHTISKDGTLSITNARYRTRIRKGNQTTVIVTNSDGQEFSGEARSSNGKKTGIRFTGPRISGTLASIRVVGRQNLTNTEKACNEMLLLFLQKKKFIHNSVFIRMLWFPPRRRPDNANPAESTSPPASSIPLNDSQLEVFQAMVLEDPLVIVHGPPGTGKTTTISAAASHWDKLGQNAWIVAHSNVSVKNIAEKLVKNHVDFKIIVSKEFHFEWHEHMYNLIGENLIRTDELPTKAADTQNVLGSSCIVLSTLSTLSNPALVSNGLFKLVPVERLVVDEASQINVFDFMSVFAQFSELKKVCFFGDPKQLPPYGQETVPGLQTIFDLAHLRGSGKFLNIQYRMPIPIGNFISNNVYDGRLLSEHDVTQLTCASFINVAEGTETKGGFSWRNPEEIRTIVHLVRNYYRYKNFCVITPYDAQRASIEKALKDEGLPWECVFNVDSFQGNEAEYILISVVKTGQPGFLTSLNRMNVMLTRCQAGLVVVTNRSFIRGGGWNTLLGQLARYWEERRGDNMWVEWRSVADSRADLPGAAGRTGSSNFSRITPPPPTSENFPQRPSSSQNPAPSLVNPVSPTHSDEHSGWSNDVPQLLLGSWRHPWVARAIYKGIPKSTTTTTISPYSLPNTRLSPPKPCKNQRPVGPHPAPWRYRPPPAHPNKRRLQPTPSVNRPQAVANTTKKRFTLVGLGYSI